MRLRTELEVASVALVAIQVLTSFAAIGLLVRMGPAVERILEENVASMHAVDDMLGALALADVDPDGAAARYADAYTRARANVTEADEPALLDRLAETGPPALAGDAVARAEAVRALDELADVNRASMARADAQEQRLGYTGAWAAALLGLTSFGVGVVVARRLVARIEGPLAELDAALQAHRRGDPHRRCATFEAPEEVLRVAQEVNELLDERVALCARAPGESARLDRVALLHLLAAAPGPLVVVDRTGALHAASPTAEDRLAADDGAALRAALGRLATDPTDPDARALGLSEVVRLVDGGGLYTLPTSASKAG